MKMKSIYMTLGVIAATALLAGCNRIEQEMDDAQGNRIVFGASTVYENYIEPETRTEYSGVDENSHTITTSSNSKYERIDWVTDPNNPDRFLILCDAATSGSMASGKMDDYTVTGTPTVVSQKSRASIEPTDGNGLRWGTGNHYFYAVYPAPGMVANYDFKNAAGVSDRTVLNSNVSIASASGNKAVVTAVVPADQNAVKVGNEYKANMNYEYMYAATMAAPRTGTSVALSFKPLVTNFEFTLKRFADSPMTSKLTKVELSSTNATLSGTFTATLAATTATDGAAAIATSGTPGKKVTLTLPDGGILLGDTPIKFNLLTLPVDQTKLTLTLYFSNNTTRTLELKKSGSWITVPACKKVYINNLGVPGDLWNYYLDAIANITLNDAQSGPGAIYTRTVKSYRQHSTNGNKEGVSWTAYALKEGTTNTWVKHDQAGWPNWCYLSKYTGPGNPSGESVDVYVAQNTFTSATAKDVVTTGDGKNMISKLQNAGMVGTETAPRDLSLYDIYGNKYVTGTNTVPSITKAGSHTANCYVVSAPGHYCFPIVYGNAIDATHGDANKVYGNAYKSRTTAGLGNYRNADNKAIQSPYILEDTNLATPTNLEVIVLWQDTTVGFRIIDDGVPVDGNPWPLRIVDAPSGAGLPGHKYIQFYIGPESILPGNVVIALRDRANGKVLWNWQIWVTTTAHSSASNYFAIRDLSYRSNLNNPSTLKTLKILHCPIGWTPPLDLPNRSTSTRTTKIKIVPDSGDAAPVIFTVKQGGITSPAYKGTYYSHTVYQWGRKDPFVGSAGGYKNKSFFSHYYDFTALADEIVVYNEDLGKSVYKWIRQPYYFDNSAATAFSRFDLWNFNNRANAYSDDPTNAIFQQTVGKTIYDPSPAGFCVPKGSAFTGFTTDGRNQRSGDESVTTYTGWCGKKVVANDAAGRPASFMMSHTANKSNYDFYIPGSGYRHPNTPTLYMQAYHGNAWMAVPRTDHVAWDLDWDPDQIEPLHYNETYGFCVYPQVQE